MLALLLFTLNFLAAEPWTATTCRFPKAAMAEWRLNSAQLNAICQASPNYNIDFLSDGRRTIVLTGELHQKYSDAEVQGRQLLAAFPFRAFEGYPFSPQQTYVGADFDKIAKFFDNIFDLFTRGQTRSGSTVSAAVTQGYTLWWKGHDMVTLNGEGAMEATPEQFAQHAELWRDHVVNVHLERDPHVWSQVEQCLRPHDTSQCAPEIIFGLRNAVMTEYLMKTIAWFPDQPAVLALVGAGHVTGLRHNLVCDHGFKAVRVTRGLSVPDAVRLPESSTMDLCPATF